ncbi:hypothetical protein BgiMline_012217, partial [Biomphalaria glabrata]
SSDFDVAETVTKGFEQWLVETLDTSAEEFLKTSTVDEIDPHAWRHVPDVPECYVSKLTTPADGQWDAAQQSEKFVATSLAAVETTIGSFPTTVDRANAIWLSKDVFK